MLSKRLVLMILAAAIPFAAQAQNALCIDPNTRQTDQQGTATLQQLVQTADQQLMQKLVGVWYAELRSPAANQIDYHYQSFEPGGLYQYTSKVCGGMTNMCSDYQGAGLYAVRQQGDGMFFGLIVVSDLHRDRQCAPLHGRFIDATTIADDTGNTWKRAR